MRNIPASRKYVADFEKKFGYTPSYYGAQSYDGIMLIDSAVRAVNGNLADKKGMIAAMRKANFASTRGKFAYNNNHFPIQNFYLLKAVAGPAGKDPALDSCDSDKDGGTPSGTGGGGGRGGAGGASGAGGSAGKGGASGATDAGSDSGNTDASL